jgi:hypothetical protein
MSPESLALAAALIVGTSSLAVAQAQGSSGPDGQATDGAADNPSAPGSGSSDASTRAARHQHHRMYMMSVNRTHKSSKLPPANNDKPLSEWLHRP